MAFAFFIHHAIQYKKAPFQAKAYSIGSYLKTTFTELVNGWKVFYIQVNMSINILQMGCLKKFQSRIWLINNFSFTLSLSFLFSKVNSICALSFFQWNNCKRTNQLQAAAMLCPLLSHGMVARTSLSQVLLLINHILDHIQPICNIFIDIFTWI